MQKYKEKLEQILSGLAFNITEGGLQKLKELITYLQDFEAMIKNEEVYETVNIGMFHGTVQVRNVNWSVLIEKLDDLPTIEDEEIISNEVDNLFEQCDDFSTPQESETSKTEKLEDINVEEISEKLKE